MSAPISAAADRSGASPSPVVKVSEQTPDEQVDALRRELAAKDREIQRLNERLRLAVSCAGMGTWDWNTVTGALTWSEETYRLLGHAPFSFEPTYEALVAQIHPEDLARSNSALLAARDERRSLGIVLRVIWPDGSVHWLRSHAHSELDEQGNLRRMFGVTLDVDLLQRAQQVDDADSRLRAIAEATPGTIFTIHEAADGRRSFPYVTQHLRDTHGIDPEDLKRNPTLLIEHMHPDDAPLVVAANDRSARSMTMWHRQFRYRHPTKGEVWLEAYASPVRDPDGGILWHTITHDITHIKRAEMELTHAREKAEAADRAKTEFLANMSHEIRTPMTAILGYVEILSSQLTDPDDLQSLATIRRNGNYLIEIIDEILDLSRIGAGKLKLEAKQVCPDQLVLDVLSLFKVRAAEKNLKLTAVFGGPLPQTIATDPTRLRQILINLTSNAIKFTDAGEVKLVVRFLADESRLEFAVIDTGIGIAADRLPQLFRPFTQADSSVTRRFGGSGLGLSICSALAKLLGGSLAVATELGSGSMFTLTIDAGDVAHVPLVESAAVRPEPIDHERPARTLDCRVLVVDDRRDMRHLVQHMLEEAGAHVTLAADGREALARVAEARTDSRPFDAIVLDMQMPVLDGYATALELRRLGHDQPIIAITAHAMKEDEAKCLASGCDGYLRKPLERQRLVECVALFTKDLSREQLAAKRRALGQQEAGNARVRVLVVDDDPSTCIALERLLRASGYEVESARTGRDAVRTPGSFDTVLLDLSLTDMPTEKVIAELKNRHELEHCRFICFTGRNANECDWRSLGFDQFVQKPADIAVLEVALRPRANG